MLVAEVADIPEDAGLRSAAPHGLAARGSEAIAKAATKKSLSFFAQPSGRVRSEGLFGTNIRSQSPRRLRAAKRTPHRPPPARWDRALAQSSVERRDRVVVSRRHFFAPAFLP